MKEVPVYRNQSIDLIDKSMDWILHHRDIHHERVKKTRHFDRKSCNPTKNIKQNLWNLTDFGLPYVAALRFT